MKPVELEIFLQDGLTPGLRSAGKTVQNFSNDTKRQLKDVTGAITVQRGIVRDLEKQYRDLEKTLKKAAPGQPKFQASAQLEALKKELDAEKDGLEELTKQQRELKVTAENTDVSLRQQLRNVREEIATLLLAYRSLTDQEKQTAQGKELARHIDELTERAGNLNDAMSDTAQGIRNAASDSRGFDQLAGGIQLVVDGFGLATAGAQVLGLSEAELIEVQTQLQTALVASNALTSMQVNLQKQSALMQGVNNIQTKAAATAENIRTWAVGRGVIATTAATIAQSAFNAVAKANPYVLLAGAVISVVGALYAFVKGSEAAKKAEEEHQKQLEKTRKEHEDFVRMISSTAGEQIASFIKLKQAWEKLGDSFDKKKKFITDTKDEWRKLGKEINSVNDMETIFRQHSKDMLSAIILRAELKAYQSRIEKVAEQMVEDIETNKTYRYTPATTQTKFNDLTDAEKAAVSNRDSKGNYIVGGNNNLRNVKGFSSYWALSEEGAKIVTQMRKDAANADALAAQTAARSTADNTMRGYLNEMNQISDRIGNIMDNIPGLNVDPDEDDVDPKKDADSRIKQEQHLAEELKGLRWKNQQDEINQMAEGAERRRKQIALDYEKEIAEVEKQKKSFVALNKDTGAKNLNENGLTEGQQAELDRASELAVKNRDKALQEIYLLEAQHMADYLKNYGTFQQRRLTISEEYDRKIAEATDEWSRKALEKEKSSALRNLEIEAVKQSVDWGSVFGNFGTMFRDELEPTIEKLKAISKTEEFRNSDLQDQKTLYELISKLEEANTSWDNDIINKLGSDLTAYQSAMRNYMTAQEDERMATENLAEAKRKLAEAEKSGDKNAIKEAKDGVQLAVDNLESASENVRSFGTDVQDVSNSLQTSVSQANNMFNTLVSSLSGLKSGSLQGIGESLMSLDKLFNNSAITNAVGGALSKGLSKLLGNSGIGKSVAEALGSSGLIGSIISAVLSLLDILKDGIGVLVSSLIDTVLGAIAGILKNLLNGKMFIQIGKSIVDGIAGIFDALTFGGFTSWFDTSNAKEVQATIDRLTERNETLQTAIEDLTDEISASRGSKSVEAYRDAYRYQEEAIANLLGIAQAQAGYSGHHHSWNYYWRGFSEEQISRLSGQIGRSWDGNIWNLSPEEMKLLRANVDMWEQIRNTGEGGYGGRLTDKLDDYIDQAGKLEELTTQLYEGLTGISFDSMYDSFIDKLMDMGANTEDFIDHINEYFMRAMLSNKIGELYADKLEEWWKKFGAAMEDNDLTENERNALAEEYMKYVEEAMKLRDNLAAATGYGSDSSSGSGQSGKAGSFNAISQEQGTKLEGLFTSAQGHIANIDSIVEDVAEKMNRAEGYLARIAENTKANASSAAEIKDLLLKLIRDGIKTK